MSTTATKVRTPCPGSLVLPGRGHPVCARDLGRRHDVQDLGHSDGEITLATASIGIAWSLKPFWAAFLDMFKTKKFFVLLMEVVMALLCCAIAVALPLPNYFQITIAVLWVMAFASATQDICVDGVLITSLDEKGQAKYIGVQGVFWSVGRLFGTALIVYIAGTLKEDFHLSTTAAWSWAMGVSAATLALLAVYHWFMLPTGSIGDRPRASRLPSAPSGKP